VTDFHPGDLAPGGQGAPLILLVNYLLLSHEQYGTVALNNGGIANVTVIPARANPQKAFGFDTGLGNMVIDGLMRHFTRGRRTYDIGGRLAAQGRVIKPLVAEILGLAVLSPQATQEHRTRAVRRGLPRPPISSAADRPLTRISRAPQLN